MWRYVYLPANRASNSKAGSSKAKPVSLGSVDFCESNLLRNLLRKLSRTHSRSLMLTPLQS
jgi:hypothetical protein